jgi:hypothetical protein
MEALEASSNAMFLRGHGGTGGLSRLDRSRSLKYVLEASVDSIEVRLKL